jgi:hypothetical protein
MTPLDFSVTEDKSHYVMVENPAGEQARVIFRNYDGQLRVRPQPVEIPESRSVGSLRRKFYGAFGRFWISLSAAVLINGIRNAYTLGYNVSGNMELYDPAIFYDRAGKVSLAVMGCFLAESVIRYVIYTRSSERPPVELVE